MCRKIIIIALITCAINCVAKDIDGVQPELRSSNFPVNAALKEPSTHEDGVLEFKEPKGIISLSQVLSLALMQNPELEVFAWEIRAKEAVILQSSVWPNPELEFETQNFGGLGRSNEFDTSETTILLSQLIELGSKRQVREEVAALEKDRTQWDYESTKIDIFTDMTKAFVAVLAEQERLKLLNNLIHLSEEMLDTISERVRAGKVSPVEEIRADILLSTHIIQKEQARFALEAERYRLAAFWGSTAPLFTSVQGNLDYVLPAIPALETINLSVSQNPDIARWETELQGRQAALNLEKANGVPDMTIRGGYQRLSNFGDHALVLGFSIPLPFFNRNKGNVLEAQHRLVLVEKQSRASRTQVLTDLAQNYQLLLSSHQEVTALKEKILPSARKVYEATGEGYRQGKFDYLNVLDAQATLSQARVQLIDVLSNYHRTVADIERLIGRSMGSVLSMPGVDAEGDENEK